MIEIENLKSLVDIDEFFNDWKIYRAAERSIEIIAQAIIDVSSHIIAQRKSGVIPSYMNIVVILFENGIISKELTNRVANLIGMINIIIHEYLEVDLKIVFDSIESVIKDGIEFVKAIRAVLGRA